MELRHLRYFRAVAEELHFGRAAARLHIAQPPLSQQIRQLEDEVGVPLLTRSTRRVELTPAGADYLERTIAILDAVDAAGRRAQRIGDGRQGHLSIGCVGSATYSLLPQLVRAVGEELPEVEVSVRGEMLAPAQVEALRTGEIDLALLRPPSETSDLVFETVRRDRLIVVLPVGHRLIGADGRLVRVGDLRSEDFIAHAGGGRSVMNNVVAAVCATAGFVPHIRHEVEETSTLVTLVAAGLGVAIVPEPTSALGIPGVVYRHLALPVASLTPQDDPISVELAVARVAGVESPLADRVVEVLRGLGR